MSTTLAWAATATAITITILLPLAFRDPKRLRALARAGGRADMPLSRMTRRTLGWTCTIPGLALIALSQWPAFIVWMGMITAAGWFLAQTLSPAPPRA